jgi:hypothetical protein
MTEHYTTGTESVLRWCNRCAKMTMHAVSSGRVGRCLAHQSQELTKAQQRRRAKQAERDRQPELFRE